MLRRKKLINLTITEFVCCLLQYLVLEESSSVSMFKNFFYIRGQRISRNINELVISSYGMP